MGRLNVKSEEALPAFRSSLDPLCRNCHQKSAQEVAGDEGGVICEYLAISIFVYQYTIYTVWLSS